MSPRDNNDTTAAAGVRRRHSSHHDEDEDETEDASVMLDSEVEGARTRHSIDAPRREEANPISDPEIHGSSSSAIEQPPQGSGSRHSHDHVPHVRFSEDIERKDTSKRPPRPFAPSSRPQAAALDRPGTPTLSINTGLAVGSSATGSRRGLSPSSVGSPRSTNPPQRSPASPHSPTSARHRGYSLRRTIFNKGINSSTDGDTSPIELSHAGPSTQTHEGNKSRSSEDAGKKSSETTITISAAPPDAPRLNPWSGGSFAEKKSKGIHTSGALPNYEEWVRQRAAKSGVITRARSIYKAIRRRVLKINEITPSKDGRHLDLDLYREQALTDERTNRPYVGNTIRSSRYSAWNFLPRQLFAQFSKLANFYFLCVSILQMIPSLSTTGTYTTIVPLLFFVTISIAKEGYDDLRRYRLDKAENNREASIFTAERHICAEESQAENKESRRQRSVRSSFESTNWKSTAWKDIQVGNIVRLRRNEAAPSDIIILHANGENNAAYVETMALDGETNLKSKSACAAMVDKCSSLEKLARLEAHLVVEDPNLDLYNFEGRVTIDGETIPLTNNEVVYRGSILRNTPEAIGLVIYSGEECKIRMNATKNPRIKAPALQAKVNKVVIIIVIFVIALSIFNTVAYQIWSDQTEDNSWYLANAGVSFFPILASFIIMFNTMIPLSLYVSLEIVKLAQIFLMNDVDMYDEKSNTPMEARTSTINEELGQVSYIFSDKTGTLTDNTMRFRKMSVAGTFWLHDYDLQREAAENGNKPMLRHKKRKGKKAVSRKSMASDHHTVASRKSDASHRRNTFDGSSKGGPSRSSSSTSAARPPVVRQATRQSPLRTRDLLNYIIHKPYTVFAKKARFFLLSIALCHTCLPERSETGEIDYQAASPDELALVRAAQEMDYIVVDRQSGSITIKIFPHGPEQDPVFETYQVLDVIEFSSKRKRMSIVVRLPDQRICILCKGADSAIMRLLRQSKLASEKANEVEHRASVRRSMEAQQAIRRNSEHASRKSSFARPSIALGRPSNGGMSRSSMTTSRLHPIKDELDNWLTDRERDVEVSSMDGESIHFTPRGSLSVARPSITGSETTRASKVEQIELIASEAVASNDSLIFERNFQHVNDFATEGLRTLMYGYRFIEESEYSNWKKIYQDATTSLVDRQDMIEKAGEMIERDFELAGSTAIEDRLQKGVPEAIDKLRRAKIKMWMLTGDKRETAINIGHSCRLIKDYSTMTILDHEVGNLEQHVGTAIIDVGGGNIAHSVVVIDGQTLGIIEDDRTLAALFFDLAVLVDSVICCRASPSQKASLVKTIRKKVKNSVTLAIGDGANDIAMIQEAHVGIGITGKEGLQAARISDYSIAQFRFLLKLLLVHGRWNYIRTCKYTLGTFWKEMLFYLTQALYQRWAGYTGTSLYESWSLSMFNTLFTSLPVIFLGIFEKDLSASTLLAVPELYTKGQRSEGFNIKIYLGWMFFAASEAMVVFFVMLGLFGRTTFTDDNGLYAMGVLTFTACVILIAAKMQAIEMHNISIMNALGAFLCVAGWFLWNIILAAVYKNNTIYNVKGGFLGRFGDNPLWWLVLILIVVSCVAVEIGAIAIRSFAFPTDLDFFQECERDLAIRKRFEEAASSELQVGWDRGKKKSSVELEREKHIQDLLDQPRIMEEGNASIAIGTSHMRRGTHSRSSSVDEDAYISSPLVDSVSITDIERRERAPYQRDISSDPAESVLDTAGNSGHSSRRTSAEIHEMLRKGFGAIRK